MHPKYYQQDGDEMGLQANPSPRAYNMLGITGISMGRATKMAVMQKKKVMRRIVLLLHLCKRFLIVEDLKHSMELMMYPAALQNDKGKILSAIPYNRSENLWFIFSFLYLSFLLRNKLFPLWSSYLSTHTLDHT